MEVVMSSAEMYPGIVKGARVVFAGDPYEFPYTTLTRASIGRVVSDLDNDFEDIGDVESGPLVTGHWFVWVLWENARDEYDFNQPLEPEEEEDRNKLLARVGVSPEDEARLMAMPPSALRTISDDLFERCSPPLPADPVRVRFAPQSRRPRALAEGILWSRNNGYLGAGECEVLVPGVGCFCVKYDSVEVL